MVYRYFFRLYELLCGGSGGLLSRLRRLSFRSLLLLRRIDEDDCVVRRLSRGDLDRLSSFGDLPGPNAPPANC